MSISAATEAISPARVLGGQSVHNSEADIQIDLNGVAHPCLPRAPPPSTLLGLKARRLSYEYLNWHFVN